MKAAWIGWSRSPAARPSIVVTSRPSRVAVSVRHERTRRPSTSTVQAPHWPWSQPFLRAGESERLAQGIEQHHAGIDVERSPRAVDFQDNLDRILHRGCGGDHGVGRRVRRRERLLVLQKRGVKSPSPPVIVCPRNARRVGPTSVNVGISWSNACSSAVNWGSEVSSKSSFIARSPGRRRVGPPSFSGEGWPDIQARRPDSSSCSPWFRHQAGARRAGMTIRGTPCTLRQRASRRRSADRRRDAARCHLVR